VGEIRLRAYCHHQDYQESSHLAERLAPALSGVPFLPYFRGCSGGRLLQYYLGQSLGGWQVCLEQKDEPPDSAYSVWPYYCWAYSAWLAYLASMDALVQQAWMDGLEQQELTCL